MSRMFIVSVVGGVDVSDRCVSAGHGMLRAIQLALSHNSSQDFGFLRSVCRASTAHFHCTVLWNPPRHLNFQSRSFY